MIKRLFECRAASIPGRAHFSASVGKDLSLYCPETSTINIVDPTTAQTREVKVVMPPSQQGSDFCFTDGGDAGFWIGSGRNLWQFDSEGQAIRQIGLPFIPLGLEAAGGGLLTFGRYEGYLVHWVNSDGVILKSYFKPPTPAMFDERPYATDALFASQAGDGTFATLIQTTAGIIDLVDLDRMELQKRFVLHTRDILPIAQYEVHLRGELKQRAGTDMALWLTFPNVFGPSICSLRRAEKGFIATMGCGRHILRLDRTLQPVAFFSLERIFETKPDMVTVSGRPFVFEVLQAGEKWIACSTSGLVVSFDSEDLREVPPNHCLYEFRSNKYWGLQRTAEGVAVPGLDPRRVEENRKRLGHIPDLSHSMIGENSSFWLSIGGGALEVDLELDEGGAVIQASLARDILHYPLPVGQESGATDVLDGLRRIRFNVTAHGSSRRRLRVIIHINGPIASLISSTDRKLLQTIALPDFPDEVKE